MENRQVIGVVVVLALMVGLGSVIWMSRPTATGAVAAGGSASGMSSEGFASEADMMAAHHPDQASQAQKTGANQGFASEAEMMAAHHPSGGQAPAAGSDNCGGVGTPAAGVSAPAYVGTTSDYGITYDDAGYQKLLAAEKQISLSAVQNKVIVGLNVQMPCCGVTALQASNNCECGHHVALFGLAKLLATKDYSRENIQVEIDKWKGVFYPGGSSSGTGGC